MFILHGISLTGSMRYATCLRLILQFHPSISSSFCSTLASDMSGHEMEFKATLVPHRSDSTAARQPPAYDAARLYTSVSSC